MSAYLGALDDLIAGTPQQKKAGEQRIKDLFAIGAISKQQYNDAVPYFNKGPILPVRRNLPPIMSGPRLNSKRGGYAYPPLKSKKQPVAMRRVIPPVATGVILTRPRVPQMRSGVSGTIVSNTEQMRDVTSAALGAFSLNVDALIPTTFGWLGALSDLYSKYRWRKIKLIYIPACPTTTPGSTCMSLGYDRFDTNPASIQAMQQAYKAITFPPYAGYDGVMALQGGNVSGAVVVDVDVTRFSKTWYPVVGLAAFNVFPTNVQTAYCPATCFTASANGPATGTFFGTVHAMYEIEFTEPINPTQNA